MTKGEKEALGQGKITMERDREQGECVGLYTVVAKQSIINTSSLQC